MTVAVGAAEPPQFPSGHRVMPFTNAHAPVHMDRETGHRKVMTSTRFQAEGYEVVQVGPDAWLVDLDSRREALPPGADKPAFEE